MGFGGGSWRGVWGGWWVRKSVRFRNGRPHEPDLFSSAPSLGDGKWVGTENVQEQPVNAKTASDRLPGQDRVSADQAR
jgi:hypothetical protein